MASVGTMEVTGGHLVIEGTPLAQAVPAPAVAPLLATALLALALRRRAAGRS